jgi:hypothetical protein
MKIPRAGSEEYEPHGRFSLMESWITLGRCGDREKGLCCIAEFWQQSRAGCAVTGLQSLQVQSWHIWRLLPWPSLVRLHQHLARADRQPPA